MTTTQRGTLTEVATDAYQPDHDAFPVLDAYEAVVDATVTTLETEVDN